MGTQFASLTELTILRLLNSAPAGMYGLELVKTSGGLLKRGTVYVMLGRMEEKGLVRSRTKQDEHYPQIPRLAYPITALGARALAGAELMGWKPIVAS